MKRSLSHSRVMFRIRYPFYRVLDENFKKFNSSFRTEFRSHRLQSILTVELKTVFKPNRINNRFLVADIPHEKRQV